MWPGGRFDQLSVAGTRHDHSGMDSTDTCWIGGEVDFGQEDLSAGLPVEDKSQQPEGVRASTGHRATPSQWSTRYYFYLLPSIEMLLVAKGEGIEKHGLC